MSFEEELLKEMNTYKPISANWFIFKETIDKHCVDKQRVKEAVGEIIKYRGLTIECQIQNSIACEKERILKELGL